MSYFTFSELCLNIQLSASFDSSLAVTCSSYHIVHFVFCMLCFLFGILWLGLCIYRIENIGIVYIWYWKYREGIENICVCMELKIYIWDCVILCLVLCVFFVGQFYFIFWTVLFYIWNCVILYLGLCDCIFGILYFIFGTVCVFWYRDFSFCLLTCYDLQLLDRCLWENK